MKYAMTLLCVCSFNCMPYSAAQGGETSVVRVVPVTGFGVVIQDLVSVEATEAGSKIAPISSLAREAFKSDDCRKLFSGVDVISPEHALDTIWDRIDISFGEIPSILGEPREAETSGEGLRVGTRSSFPFVGFYYARANIKFNSQYWITGDERSRLTSFIHELGHAMSFLSVGSITGGFVQDDRSPLVNRANDALITEKCVNPLLSR